MKVESRFWEDVDARDAFLGHTFSIEVGNTRKNCLFTKMCGPVVFPFPNGGYLFLCLDDPNHIEIVPGNLIDGIRHLDIEIPD